jgi:zinc transport system ATP-binding protein
VPVVRLQGVSFSYETGAPVLKHVDLTVEAGELVAIAGPNGGGKTTLVRLIVGLERPSEGTVERFGEPLERGKGDTRVGYLPQRAEAALSAPITVRELVEAGRAAVGGTLRPLNEADEAAIEDAIARVGLSELAGRQLAKVSGGQRQRAFIAKALAASPELLILDEPSAGVDPGAQDALAELVGRLSAELGVAVLYVSHEFGAIEPHVRRLLIVRGGIAFDGPPGDLAAGWHDPSHHHPPRDVHP